MSCEPVNPKGWPRAKGYSNGMLAPGGLLAVAGMIGWDVEEKLVGSDIVSQFDQALANVVAVVVAAGGSAGDILSLRLSVTDKREYLATVQEIGTIYRKHMGKHYPAMALYEVKGLLEPGAKVEIEAMAHITPGAPHA